MTREMNKPEWELARYECGFNKCPIYHNLAFIDCDKCSRRHNPQLGDWIKPFVQSINERFKKND